MGAITSRQHAGVEEVDIISNHAYKYPPRSGNYFGSHFIMGGERFDTPQPESYLFGENTDLNFLGSRPTPFPYPPPQPNEPTKTLKCLVNIRKESLRFVRAPIDYSKPKLDHDGDVELGKNTSFNIEFTFDCDVRCAITVYYFATEDFNTTGVSFTSRDSKLTSETYHYKRGANQQFCQMSHIFDPSKYNEDELLYDIDREVIPIAIHCVAEDGPDEPRQSHTTIAAVDKTADGTYMLKALKQKLFVDGLCYLLQEIYGIENKQTSEKHHRSHQTTAQNIADVGTDVPNSPSGDTNVDVSPPSPTTQPSAPPPPTSSPSPTPSPTPSRTASSTDDGEDNGSECVICMCDVRDTLILPCRHLCLCNSCADSLRYQANNCPICRAPFRALLQVRALQKVSSSASSAICNAAPATVVIPAVVGNGGTAVAGSPPDPTCDNIPPGYQAVSLIEALNGPCTPRSSHITSPPPHNQPPPPTTLTQPPTSNEQHPDNNDNVNVVTSLQAAQILNRPDYRGGKISGGADRKDGGKVLHGGTTNQTEFGMSLLVLRDDEGKETPKCPLLSESTVTSRPKHLRDSVRHINEKSGKIEISDEVDNEAEKLSPLLETAMLRNCLGGLTLNMADVDPIDDNDDDNDNYTRSTSQLEKPKNYGRSGESDRADESDHFYTPEDPTAPLPHTPATPSPTSNHLHTSSADSTPQHLLGTPASRSVDSRESYSSSSGAGSTKHLLMCVDRGDRAVGERLGASGDRNREVRL